MNWYLHYRIAYAWHRLRTKLQKLLLPLEALSQKHQTSKLIAEHLVNGEFESAFRCYESAKRSGYVATSAQLFELFAGSGKRAEAYDAFKILPLARHLRKAFGNKYVSSLDDIKKIPTSQQLLVLASGGPGDEIHFGAFYRMLLAQTKAQVTFSCDPRLKDLFQRSLPGATFVGVNRLHRLWNKDYASSLKSARKLPKLSLYRAMDDSIWETRHRYSAVALFTDLLGDLERQRINGDVGHYLVPPQHNSRQVPAGVLIGFCWRSILLSPKRDIHYLKIEQMRPLLDMDSVQFLCLQAGLAGSEREWLQRNYPDKVSLVSDIDMLNDFDRLSALIKTLDAVVSPATYIAELAAAIGVETNLLSNSSMNFYRRDIAKRDLLYPNVFHCEPDVVSATSSQTVDIVPSLLKRLLPLRAKTGISNI